MEHAALEKLLLEHKTIIATLEAALASRPAVDPMSLVSQFNEQILVDQPYPDGKIPDNVWLTPGDNERMVKA